MLVSETKKRSGGIHLNISWWDKNLKHNRSLLCTASSCLFQILAINFVPDIIVYYWKFSGAPEKFVVMYLRACLMLNGLRNIMIKMHSRIMLSLQIQ